MKLYFIIAFFVLLNAFFIISNNELSINNTENLKIFFILYVDWIKTTFNNILTISGNAIKMDWFPKTHST